MFEASPAEQAKLTVVDAYSDISKQDLADPTATVVGGAVDVLNNIFTADKLTDLGKDLGKALIKDKLDEGKAKELLGNLLGADVKGDLIKLGYTFGDNLLKSVGFGGASDSIIKGLLGLPGGQRPEQWLLNKNPTLQVALNQGTQIFKLVQNGLDAKSAGNAINLIQRFAKDTMGLDVIDITAKSNVFKSVLDVAGKFKIPEILDGAFDSLKEGERKEVILGNLASGVINTGLPYLSKVADMYSGPEIFSSLPGVIGTALENFEEVLVDTKDEALSQLTTTMNLFDLVDPEWKTKLLNNEQVSVLDRLVKANDSAVKTLILSAQLPPPTNAPNQPTDKSLAIAAAISVPFKQSSFKELVTEMYPNYVSA